MSDVFEHNPGDHEDPLTGPTWMIGFLGSVLLAVIVLGLTALVYNATSEEEKEKLILRDPDELNNLRNQQLAQITAAPRWREVMEKPADSEVEQKTRALTIPIDMAMEAVVKETGQGQRQ
jgi:Flp pilus assembly protein TadD